MTTFEFESCFELFANARGTATHVSINGGEWLGPSAENQAWMGALKKELRAVGRRAKIPYKEILHNYARGATDAMNGHPPRPGFTAKTTPAVVKAGVYQEGYRHYNRTKKRTQP